MPDNSARNKFKRRRVEENNHCADRFVKRARKVHGYRYDYSKTVYVFALEKVTITCPEHGDFLQTPASHLYGRGCPECGKRKASETKSFSAEQFSEKSSFVHNGYFSYDKVSDYKNNYSKVTITCPKHGDFLQSPMNHLRGHGCPRCSKSGPSKMEDELAFEILKILNK